jgi:Mg-chelatase subunit ChlD
MFDVMVASDHWQCWFGLLVWLLVSGGPNRVACQDSAELTFRQTVAEVRLTLVGTEHGQGVANLSSRDFAVVDNDDIIRSFTGFVPAEKTALDVTVLVDGSESVLSHFKQEIAEAMLLESVAGGLPEDKLSLIAFRGSRPEIVCAGNCRQMHAFDRLSSLPVESSTPLFDSLELAARLLSQRRDPQVQPVLIVFSDGQDTISRNSASDALRALWASGAQTYVVDSSGQGYEEGTRFLRAIANLTGGQYFSLADGGAGALASVIEDRHAAYILTYKVPTPTPGFHLVRVLPTQNPNLQFRCRQGYYYAADGQ